MGMGLGQWKKWALDNVQNERDEPRPPRIIGRDDAHNADDGVNHKWWLVSDAASDGHLRI